MNELDIFSAALDLTDPTERSRFLDEACGDSSELRQRIEALLSNAARASQFLEAPAPEFQATIDQPITEKPGTQIGPYKLLQQLGEGGMGVVYMAEQKEPVKRRVALKIIKPGMDTRQVIARFEAERQALAMMDHPNIAKVLDAGATDSGRPYFVMELVNGISVTDYCDEQHLSPKERLELFVPICQAVQHAHQKGIVHRDLKPSNVLIAQYDDQVVPKVIDFGVAKATSQSLTEKTMFTQLGQIVGTLEYMSPEQAQRNQLDIDTRSDIYSLGVLLYELLTGDTPFDRQRLRSAAFDEMLRIIREEEPSKPSIKVSGSESLSAIAANRKIEPDKLSLLVRGELDWIVMKALEKDRGRRYATATSFAEDIQHYLNDEAVVACPPSARYRFRKFARRNKAALSTAAIVGTALLLGIVGTTWQAIQATRAVVAERHAHKEADRAWEAESRQRTMAERERDRAEENLILAIDALDTVYVEAIGRDRLFGDKNRPDAGAKLSTAEKRLLETGLSFYSQIAEHNKHSSRAKLQTANAFLHIGTIQAGMSESRLADTALLEAIARFEELTKAFPASPVYTTQLGKAYLRLGIIRRYHGPNIEGTYRSAVGALTKGIQLDPRNAQAYQARGRARSGYPLYEWKEAVEDFSRAIEIDAHSDVYSSRALAYAHLDNYERAVADYGEAILLDSNNHSAYEQRGQLYARKGLLEMAIADYNKAIRLRPQREWIYRLRAAAYVACGQLPDAVAYAEQVAEMDDGTPYSGCVQACLLLLANDPEGYREICSQMLVRFGETTNAFHANTVARTCTLASNPVGAPDQLARLAELAVADDEKSPYYLHTLGMAHYRAGQFDRAVCRFEQSLDIPWEARVVNWVALALALHRSGDETRARKWMNKVLAWSEEHNVSRPSSQAATNAVPLDHPYDFMEYLILLREAEQLIGSSTAHSNGKVEADSKNEPTTP